MSPAAKERADTAVENSKFHINTAPNTCVNLTALPVEESVKRVRELIRDCPPGGRVRFIDTSKRFVKSIFREYQQTDDNVRFSCQERSGLAEMTVSRAQAF